MNAQKQTLQGVAATREQIFEWTDEGQPSRFWSVGMAKELINQARARGFNLTQRITLNQVIEAAAHNYEMPKLLPEHVAAADLSEPIISIELHNLKTGRDEAMVIDGWHRIRKWIENPHLLPNGMEVYHLPAVVALEIERMTAEAMSGGSMVEHGDDCTLITRIIKPEGGQ